jgi:hypothetical protein
MNRSNDRKTTADADSGDRAQIRALPWALSSGVLISFFSFWTFGGSLFVLFLNELGLPKGRIGIVLALFPLCGLLALYPQQGQAPSID